MCCEALLVVANVVKPDMKLPIVHRTLYVYVCVLVCVYMYHTPQGMLLLCMAVGKLDIS